MTDDTPAEKLAAAKRAIVEFHWWNYGLDEVSNAQSDEWAEALAEAVIAALAHDPDKA